MRSMDGAWYDSMYNPRAAVADYAVHLQRWADESAAVRAALPVRLDLPYGASAGETLDVFAARKPGAPVLVFVHGGYWRGLDKADSSFIARPFVEAGACVVIPNYMLCPAVTVPQIVRQVAEAVAWTWRHAADHGGDPARIVVAGHSAGGHLAAMMRTCLWPVLAADLPADLVHGALSISGLHELEPLRRSPFLQPTIQLTLADVARASPARLPPSGTGPIYAVVGAEESSEFQRQNELLRRRWGRRRVPVTESLAGLNHFSVLEALADPRHRLHQLALELLGL